MFDPTEHTQTCDSEIPHFDQEECVRMVKATVFVITSFQKLHKQPSTVSWINNILHMKYSTQQRENEQSRYTQQYG